MMQLDLFRMFDRCVVINLARRADRLAKFQRQLDDSSWPFRPVEIVKAIDGNRVPQAPPWESGGGAWGCRQSHLRALEDALNDGVDSLLVMEDDAYIHRPEAFVQEASEFFGRVPADWDALWLGGQNHNEHIRPVREVKPGIMQVTDCQRTHCYAVRGEAMKALYLYYQAEQKYHIDWYLHKFQERHRVYCPMPFLFGQDEGVSDISGANNPRKLFVSAPENMPVYWFKDTPRETIEALRDRFHFGRSRDELGRDVGLNEIVAEADRPAKIQKLKNWISMIHGESFSMRAATSIWHPDLEERYIRLAARNNLTILENPTIEAAEKALAA